jgi:allantoinase
VLTIRSTRVVLPEGERAASIQIEDGVIKSVTVVAQTFRAASDAGLKPCATSTLDFGDLVISPGIVDTHVHVNEPGRTEWEGFDTATRAAAAGGVTTLVDMPLNSIPATTTAEALEAKRAAARGKCSVDVGFWGGVVPGNDGDLDALVDAGVRGFKCFLVPSGVDEFPAVDERDLRRAMPILARRDVPLLVHAESPALIQAVGAESGARPELVLRQAQDERRRVGPGGHVGPPLHEKYAVYLATRPPAAEVEAIRLMVRLAREFDVRTHIVHVAAAEAVEEIERAKADGVRITAETCPHYLTFAAEDIPDGATEFKCAPPIREAAHRSALWDGLQRGVLDMIATDHSPAPPAMKCRGDFMRAWGGIASLEVSLAAIWTGVARPFQGRVRGPERAALHPADLATWMSEFPAALARLGDRKGRIAAGYDADLVVWDPDAEFTVDAAALQQRHKVTPYDGRRLRGRVMSTFVRGQRVWDNGTLTCGSVGRLL